MAFFMLSIHNQIEAHMMHQMIKEMARMKVLKLTFHSIKYHKFAKLSLNSTQLQHQIKIPPKPT